MFVSVALSDRSRHRVECANEIVAACTCAAFVMQMSEVEAELLDRTSPVCRSPVHLHSLFASTGLSVQGSPNSRARAVSTLRAGLEELHTPRSMMSIDNSMSADSNPCVALSSSPPEQCEVIQSVVGGGAITFEETTSSPSTTPGSSSGRSSHSVLSTFSFDSGSDISLDEADIQANYPTPHGRLTVYAHGRESCGRPSIALCRVTTGARHRVLQPIDDNLQDDSPAPAMPESVAVMRRRLTDQGAVHLPTAMDEH